jgi:uncharacterized protein
VIAYFDTSALVPLIVEESGSDVASRVWEAASHVVSVRLVYPEARAALAQASRVGRIPQGALPGAVEALEGLYGQLDLLEADERLVRRAGVLAEQHALRGYDAIHLAGAERLGQEGVVLVAGDRQLLAAGRELEFSLVDTSGDARS